MSTKFGILTEHVDHNKLVDEEGDLHDYISTSIFEPIFHRGSHSRWLNNMGPLLPNDVKVYPLDNTPQGIYTIKDCKKILEAEKTALYDEQIKKEVHSNRSNLNK